jgi:hypothetical protein
VPYINLCSLVKKNERIQRDAEEDLNQLQQATSEYENLKSSAVSLLMFLFSYTLTKLMVGTHRKARERTPVTVGR